MISILITLLIILIVASVGWWILSMIPLPQPIANIVKVVLAAKMLIWLMSRLLPLERNHPFLR